VIFLIPKMQLSGSNRLWERKLLDLVSNTVVYSRSGSGATGRVVARTPDGKSHRLISIVADVMLHLALSWRGGDPRYVDVIIRRYEALTGTGAILADSGEAFEQVATRRRDDDRR
jgi:hypothetical protein